MDASQLARIRAVVGPRILAADRDELDAAYTNLVRAIADLRALGLPAAPDPFEVGWTP